MPAAAAPSLSATTSPAHASTPTAPTQIEPYPDTPFSGIPWALAGCAFTATSFLFAKLLGQSSHYSAFEINVYRSLIMMVLLGLFAVSRGYSLKTPCFKEQWSRATTGWSGAILQMFALSSLVPMPTIQMLSYTNPIFLVLILAIWQKKSVAPQVWGGVVFGFTGAGVLLLPQSTSALGTAAMLPMAAALGSGFLTALSFLNIQKLARTGEPAWRVVFYFALISLAYSTLGLIASGEPFKGIHTEQDALWIAGMGLCILVGQLCTTRSYSQGNASVTAVFSYSHILFATFFSFMIFNQSLDLLSSLGIAIIILGGLLTRTIKS